MRKSNGSRGSRQGRLLLIHYTFGVRLIEEESVSDSGDVEGTLLFDLQPSTSRARNMHDASRRGRVQACAFKSQNTHI